MIRANYSQLSHDSYLALVALDKTLTDSPLERALIDLVKIRASQINGCLFCLDMHSKEARTHGERELRLYHLSLWRESALFSVQEKAALELTELLTKPGPHGIDDDFYAKAAEKFSEKEFSDLCFVIASINAWNRLGIVFRAQPGSYDKILGLEKIGLS